jgi:hypothetical protein
MPISFNSLPSEKPNKLPEKGKYILTILKAEMKTPSDPKKPDYLNMQLALTNGNGVGAGNIYDMLSESDNEIVRYKLQRFITALGLEILDTFELKDLCKVIVGKQLIGDITHEKPKEGSPYPPKAIIDVFSDEIYYPMSMAPEFFAANEIPFEVVDAATPLINAPDAADGQQPGTENPQQAIRY